MDAHNPLWTPDDRRRPVTLAAMPRRPDGVRYVQRPLDLERDGRGEAQRVAMVLKRPANCPGKEWSHAEISALFTGRAAGKTWFEIAASLNRTAMACESRYGKVRRAREAAAARQAAGEGVPE